MMNFWLAFLLFALSLLLNLRLLFVNVPMDYTESSFVLTTQLLADGKNPYSIANSPAFVNLYGILNNILISPLMRYFDNAFFIHRLFSLVFCLLTIATGSVYLRKKRLKYFTLFLAASFMYLQIFLFSSNKTSQPDSLGMFLFVLSILVADSNKDKLIFMYSGVLLSLVAFLAKPYFILGAFCISFYYTLFGSKIRGIFLLLFTTIAFGVMLYFLNQRYDTYIFSTIITHIYSYDRSLKNLLIQVLILVPANFYGLFTLMIVYLRRLKGKKPRINFSNINKPLFYININLVEFSLIFFMGVFFFFGQHVGNKYGYFTHLVTPFLLILGFINFRKVQKLFGSKAVNLVISLNLIVLLSVFLLIRSIFKPFDFKNYYSLLKELEKYQNPYVSGSLARYAYKDGKEVFENSQTRFFIDTVEKGPVLTNGEIKSRVEGLKTKLNESLKFKRFDAVFVSKGRESVLYDQKYLFENYKLSEKISVKLFNGTWVEEIWIPR